MNKWKYYTATQGIWHFGLRRHALREITGRTNERQKVMRMTGQRYRDTDRRTDM